jgi:hypothetical protein
MILPTALLALCLARVQYMATKFNQTARWNGRGAILSVLDKTTAAPMVYRVLAAWTIGRRLDLYQPFQFVLIWIALYSVYLAWGGTVMLITCVLLVATFWYDYWSVWPELIGFSLALVSFPLALLGVAIHGLSRETAPLCGLAYALHSGDWIGGGIISVIGFTILWLVRRIQGKHPLYCDRWMHKKNIAMLKELKPAVLISVLFSLLALAGAWGRWDGLIPLALIGAGWTMAKGDETRVFSAALPWAALLLEKLL